jgi:AAA domain
MTARHFLDLTGAATVDTQALGLTRRAVRDVARHRALGVVHGAAGLGKTFAVERALEHLDPTWSPVWLSFPVRPTMRLIAKELLRAITGLHSQNDRFTLTRELKAELAARPRLVVVDLCRLGDYADKSSPAPPLQGTPPRGSA